MRVPALNRIPVEHLWEVAYWAAHGYHVKINGNRAWMVRTV